MNTPKLIDHWVETYPIKLQNKQLYGVFETDYQHWWQNVHPETYQGLWGVEVAADRYTKYLSSEVVTVYIPSGNEKNSL